MANKFDRFTKRARETLTYAQEEALRLGHTTIGTEHLLLGLLREGEGVAAKVLGDLGLNLSRARDAVERYTGRGNRTPGGRVELAPSTKHVIELAVDEARRLGHHYIGTEHLLLGLSREAEGMAVGILESLGVSLDQVRERTMQALRESATPNSQSERGSASGSSGAKGQQTLLDQLGVDLTAEARAGKLDPVIGRQREIERVIQILSRRTKNNPALIGEPGVGKTAIVEGIAQRIVNGETPDSLLNKRVVRLDVGSLVAGTMYRGQFEERLKRVIDEIKNSDVIIFIDELHMLVGAGAAGSSVDAANMLKPALSRGELQCIGATTLAEYRKHIESDAALERRFQPVMVEEPSVEETIEILKGVRSRYEEHHQLEITDEALAAAAHLAARYVPDRFLPDKAIDLIDEAASRVRVYKAFRTVGVRETFRQLRTIQQQKQEAFSAERYDEALALREEEDSLRSRLEQLRLGWRDTSEGSGLRVTEDDIAEIVAMWTGVPVVRIAGEESSRLLKMEEALHGRIVGQDEAVATVAKAVRRARAGLKDPKRPIGSFIFLGPTGVGKTELAKALAEFMFGSEDALIQLDMSEFMERHTVSRLVGAPPGYVGYEEAGQLTEAIRRRPYSVVCFDEVEKAHPEAFNMLLQIMEDGHLSDAKGHKVDFRNCIVIMTSNVGAEFLGRDVSLGFNLARDEAQSAEDAYQRMRDKILGELKRTFRPEFLNRLDAVVVFHRLTRDDIRAIVDLNLARVAERVAEHHVALEFTDEAKDLLAERGYDPQFGARPLRRVIQQMVEDPLSEIVLQANLPEHPTIRIDRDGDELTMTPRAAAETEETTALAK
ncbi:MAG TPA: ATP-dependent Clp protease ATP-binding subunit [Anaerolineae bacterium]|nr:ATP-dependent Clp protease ATP-binding subunit [Anaerolineae bacterium]